MQFPRTRAPLTGRVLQTGAQAQKSVPKFGVLNCNMDHAVWQDIWTSFQQAESHRRFAIMTCGQFENFHIKGKCRALKLAPKAEHSATCFLHGDNDDNDGAIAIPVEPKASPYWLQLWGLTL